VAFSPNGRLLASADAEGFIRVWQVQDGRLANTFTHGELILVLSVAFSPDGSLLASAGMDGMVKLWRVATGALERTIPAHDQWVASVAFSPDGQLLASASAADGTIKLWRVSNGTLVNTLTGHTAGVTSVAFAPRGGLLASAGEDGTVRLWRVSDGQLEHTLSYSDAAPAFSVAFSSDGSQLAAGGMANYIRVWRVSNRTLLRTLTGHAAPVVSVAFVPDSPLLVSGGADSAIKLWRVADGALLRTLTGHTLQVTSVAFAPNRNLLASGSSDSTVRIWRAADGGLERTLTGHEFGVTSVAFSPDGQLLASASEGGTVKLWRTVDGGLFRTFTAHASAVASVAFSPNGQLLATASEDGTVKLWRVANGVLQQTISAHAGYVASVAFSPDGSLLASGGEDSAIRIWRVADGGLERALTGHTAPIACVAFSPNGSLIASGSADASIKLWNVSNGTLIATLEGHSDSVYAIAFSPDGGLLASGGADRVINLWRVSDRTRLQSYSSETGTGVLAIQFSPDGRWFGYGRLDATVVAARNPFPPNRPPAVPELLAPADNATVPPTPTLRVRLADPDNDQVQAEIEIYSGTNKVRTLRTGFVASGAEASPAVNPPLEAGNYTWRARARDSAGNESEWSAPRRITVSASVPTRLAGIRTFALSLRTPTSDPNALGLNGVSIMRWDAATQQYAPATELRLGEAYFIKATNPVQPNLFGEPVAGEVVIPLKPGWNLIANPTLAPIAWQLDGVQVQRGSERRSLREAQRAGWVEDYLWAWQQNPNDPQRGQYQLVYDATELRGAAGALEPWQAYWMLARVECALVLNAQRTRAAAFRPAPATADWTLQIEAVSASGDAQAVWIGVAGGRSVRAVLAPAPPENAMRMQARLRCPEGAFAADIRPTLGRDAHWSLEVAVAPSSQPQPITLRVAHATHLPRGVNLMLVDEQSRARRPLRAAASLSFVAPAEGGVFRFRIEPMSHRALLRVLNPTVRGASRAGDALTLSFSLTAEAQVQVQIRTGSRAVRTLSDARTRSAGLHEFVWDGRDDAGVHLPPGAYIAEITAVSADGQIARAVTPIVLRR
jgi:WD40 repeat protein